MHVYTTISVISLHSFKNRAQGISIHSTRQQAGLIKECRRADVEQLLTDLKNTYIRKGPTLVQSGSKDVSIEMVYYLFFGIPLCNRFQDIKTREEGIDDLWVKLRA